MKMRNPYRTSLIQKLKEVSAKQDAAIWKTLALELEKSSKQRRAVNLSKIDRHTKQDETVVVPGKVLGLGTLNKKITIAAFNFSGQAYEKIKSSGSTSLTINELIKINPKGSKIRIFG